MNTQEQSFCELNTETNECDNTPTYIQQSEYYKNRNKPLIYKKKICMIYQFIAMVKYTMEISKCFNIQIIEAI